LYTLSKSIENYGHPLHMRVDHAKPESEFQAEQVQGVFGGSQASSYDDANIVVIKVSPVHLTNVFVFYFESFTSCLRDYALSL
jgi:hypothetical protein